MSIGAKIKEQRSKLGISQQKLANEIGVSVDTIRSLEIGRANPSVDTLLKLADLFDCTLDYLTGRSDDPRSFRKITWTELSDTLNELLDVVAAHDQIAADKFKALFDSFPKNDEEINLDDVENLEGILEAYENKLNEIEKDKGTH